MSVGLSCRSRHCDARQTPLQTSVWRGVLLYRERVTRILLTPLVQRANGTERTPARLTAIPTFSSHVERDTVTFAQLLTWNFGEYDTPNIDLAPPPFGAAWRLVLTWGAVKITRVVTFTGTSVSWEQLTEVDPDTLSELPVNEQLAAWVAVRDSLHNDMERQLAAHINSQSPHPAYDDIPDPVLIFENKLDTGLVVDDDVDLNNLVSFFDQGL